MTKNDFEYVILPLADLGYKLASDFYDNYNFFNMFHSLEVSDDEGIKRFAYIKIVYDYDDEDSYFTLYSNYHANICLNTEEVKAVYECMNRFKDYIKRREQNEQIFNLC